VREGKGKTAIRRAYVELPPNFELDWVDDPETLTPAPLNFSRSSETSLFVVWDPFDAPDFDPGDDLMFSVTGNCIVSYQGEIIWEIGQDVLELTGGVLRDRPTNTGQSCEVTVRFTLIRYGTLDSRYDGGLFRAQQEREFELQSMP
jgi:hypothetical protein